MGEYLTTQQLAARLGVSAETIRGWVQAGRIPEIRVNSKVRRFDAAAVDAALRRRDTPDGGAGHE